MRIKNVRLAATISTLALALQLGAQAPQLSKEYIYLDSRLIAVDGPPAAPPSPAVLLPSAITLTSAPSSSNHIGVTASSAWNVPTKIGRAHV